MKPTLILSQAFTKEQVPAVAQELKKILQTTPIMAFEGPIGVGKTTLIKTLLRECGIKEPITSPTFTYLNCYKNEQGEIFYHFDCYRIKSVNEFIGMGFQEYLHTPGATVLIEWPEVIDSLLTQGVSLVTLDYGPQDENRVIRCTVR